MNRVTVYERPDSNSIQIEYWDNLGRHRTALKTALRHPVTDRNQAVEIARRMSNEQRRIRTQSVDRLLGLPARHTLHELLRTLHADKSESWSEKYAVTQERYRAFWEDGLGDVGLVEVNAAMVERVVRFDARSKAWSPRSQEARLRYIIDAFNYAERKLKWIDQRHNLSAVTMPKGRGLSQAYTVAEAKALLIALETIGPVAAWMGHVALQTGRRLTAIRTLPKDAVVLYEGYTVLRFPGETDKARNTGEAAIVGRAHELTRILMGRPGKYVTGTEPPGLTNTCPDWIIEAESKAGIPHKSGRGWHGFKRLFATLAKGLQGREKQSGTTGQTLDRVYVQDHLEPKLEVARELSRQLC